MKRRTLLLLSLALLMAGCHTARKATHRTPVPPADSEVPAPPAPEPKRTYTVISFDGEVEGISINGQLRIAEDSVMWVSVNKLLEMGRAMCTPDSLWLHAPLLGRDDAMDYPTLKRLTGVEVTFDELQQTVLADDADDRIAKMAKKLGFSATIHIKRRLQVEQLSFPYPKPIKQ